MVVVVCFVCIYKKHIQIIDHVYGELVFFVFYFNIRANYDNVVQGIRQIFILDRSDESKSEIIDTERSRRINSHLFRRRSHPCLCDFRIVCYLTDNLQ